MSRTYSGVIVLSYILICLPLCAQEQQTNWTDFALQYAQKNPGNEGLVFFADAIDKMKLENLDSYKMVVDPNWRQHAAELQNLLTTNQEALQLVNRAMETGEFALPPINTLQDPIPNFLIAHILILLILTEARAHQFNGQFDAAAQKIFVALDLSERFRKPEQTLISHLIGIQGIQKTTTVLQQLLKEPGMDDELAKSIDQQREQFEKTQTNILAALEKEKATSELMLQLPEVVAVLNGGNKKLNEEIWKRNLAELHKPFWEQTPIDNQKVALELGISTPPLPFTPENLYPFSIR